MGEPLPALATRKVKAEADHCSVPEVAAQDRRRFPAISRLLARGRRAVELLVQHLCSIRALRDAH